MSRSSFLFWNRAGWTALAVIVLALGASGEERGERLREIDLRTQHLYKQIRCPVCPGQPISESEAPLSRILRKELRGKIEQGASNSEALEWLVARYGESILLRPPFSSAALLWLAPAVLGALALLLFRQRARRNQRPS